MFFAVLPPVEVRDAIARAALRLPLEMGSVPVPPENYHVTLAFVGEVSTVELTRVREIGASQRGRGFAVRLEGYEHWREAAVLVAVMREIPASLAHLWERLQTGLASQQLVHSPRQLRPHVTIARKVSQAPVLQAMSAIAWKAQTFSLMQSSASGARPTRGDQPIYTVLDTWPLLDE